MLELLTQAFLVQHLLENHNPVLTCKPIKAHSDTTEKVKLSPSEEAAQWNANNMKRICLVLSFRQSA